MYTMSRYYPGKHLVDVLPVKSRFKDLSLEDTAILRTLWFTYGTGVFHSRDIPDRSGYGKYHSKLKHREYISRVSYDHDVHAIGWKIRSEKAARLQATYGEGWNPFKWFWEQGA